MNGDDGRDAQGRFAEGNPGGPGNPNAKASAAWRKALVEAVTEDDLKAILLALVEKAKNGDRFAAAYILDRCLGKARQEIVIETGGEMPGLEVTRRQVVEEYQQRKGQPVDLGIDGIQPLGFNRIGEAHAGGNGGADTDWRSASARGSPTKRPRLLYPKGSTLKYGSAKSGGAAQPER